MVGLMPKLCPICDFPFKDGDKLVAVVLSTFVDLESGVTYAITELEKCVEIIHRECYDWPNGEDPQYYMGIQS
jgi:hypothetical protein